MVIDTSAIAAILFDEPERVRFNRKIEADDVRLISAATLVETAFVMEARKGELGRSELDLFVYEAGLDIMAFDAAQADLARLAWRTYGKGRHPAGLNLGDCFSYALAKATGEPLLFKGNDFPQTDITAC